MIRSLAEEGRTMVMVTHEMGFAREVSDEVVFLHEGRIEEKGPPSQVFANPNSERCPPISGQYAVNRGKPLHNCGRSHVPTA